MLRHIGITSFISLLLVAQAIDAAPPAHSSKPSKLTEPRIGANGGTANSGTTGDAEIYKCHPGPWGDIEWSTMYLEAPDYILETLRKPDANPHWVFPKATLDGIRELFQRAGLPEDVQQRLFDPKRIFTQEDSITLFPQLDDLENLKPAVRQVIYAELAKSPLNEYHHDPLIISGSLEDWLRDAKLRPELQNDFRRLVYPSGHALAFSDVRLILNHATTDSEVEHVFRTITRTRTLVGTLHISPGSSASQLIEYWTGNRANSDVLPILEAATSQAGGVNLDLTHLLPPLARRRLYTYPTIDLLTRGRMPDCHWTSLNFFAAMPQDYYLDMRLAANRLLEKYNPVESPYVFGDMLCFLNAEGQALHSCIYVADDVVFTKNGENSLKPWVLMSLQDVKDIYGRDSATIKGFRRKSPGPV